MAERPGLVIFDCDGVLVDSEPIANRILADLVTECGAPTTIEDSYRLYKGQIFAEIVRITEERIGRPVPTDFAERFVSLRDAELTRSLRPIDGAGDVVRAVRAAGIPVCVASQGRLEKTELTLGLTGLRPLFGAGALFSSYMVPRGKPFPDLFLHAADAMGCPPEDAVVVEDTPLGATGAAAAGMRVYGYAAQSDADALRAVGATPFHTMAELPHMLGLMTAG